MFLAIEIERLFLKKKLNQKGAERLGKKEKGSLGGSGWALASQRLLEMRKRVAESLDWLDGRR